jgi:hypothetical protein
VFGNRFFEHDIMDLFEATNDLEKIDLSGSTQITDFADLAANHLFQSGADIVIGDTFNTITLTNTNIADLHDLDFIFQSFRNWLVPAL